MAALATPCWEAVTPEARELLAVLGQLPFLRPFYLAGGTALALRLGHRISQDLDLFANVKTLDDDLRRSIVEELRVDFDIADQQDEPTMLLPVEWEQVKTFFVAQARRLGQKWFGLRK